MIATLNMVMTNNVHSDYDENFFKSTYTSIFLKRTIDMKQLSMVCPTTQLPGNLPLRKKQLPTWVSYWKHVLIMQIHIKIFSVFLFSSCPACRKCWFLIQESVCMLKGVRGWGVRVGSKAFGISWPHCINRLYS